MGDEVIALGGDGGSFGLLSVPSVQPGAALRPGIVLLTAGATHRIGPNRVYVRLARRLSAMGFFALRFDLPGVGDSVADPGEPSDTGNEDRMGACALRALAQRGVTSFVTVGICSGGDQALRLALRDDVVGAVAINATAFAGAITPAVYTHLNDATRLRLYRRRLFRWSTLKKVLGLRVNFATVGGTALRVVGHRAGEALRRLVERRRGASKTAIWEPPPHPQVLLAASEGSLAWHCMPHGAASASVRFLRYADTDHLFSTRAAQDALIRDVCQWIGERFLESAPKATTFAPAAAIE
jgi:hypothetical protein